MNIELNTTIKIKGTSEELFSMLKALKAYEVEYSAYYSHAHVGAITVKNSKTTHAVCKMEDNDINKFLSNVGKEITIKAEGMFIPDDCDLFQVLAEAAPQASFEGYIEAFGDDTEDCLKGILKDGELSLSHSCFDGFDEESEEPVYSKEKEVYDPILESYKKVNDFVIENGVLIKYNGNDPAVVVPDSVTSIGNSAFLDCRSLISVEIPDSVTSIGGAAFYGCSSLTSVEIPDSVTSIGEVAFRGCSSLTSVEIPDSVTSIGNHAFYNCSSLTSINVDDANTTYCDIDGVLFSKDKKTLITHPCDRGVTTYVIPDSVTSIGSLAFSDCSSLTSVEIGAGVKRIGDSAFFRCSSLTSVEISDSVTSIGCKAFYECSSLTNVIISDSVVDIGREAFLFCDNLRYFSIGENVETNITLFLTNGYRRSVPYCLSVPDFSKVRLTEYKIPAVRGFLDKYVKGETDEECINSYLPYIKRQRKVIIESSEDYLPLYIFLTDKKMIPVEEVDELIDKLNNAEAKAILIDYKNKQMTEEISEKIKKKAERKEALLYGAIPTVAEAKKDWEFETLDDGTIELQEYKGKENTIYIPSKIGKKQISTISARLPKDIQAVIVDENSNYFSSVDGVLFTKDKMILLRYPNAKNDTTYKIPAGVTSIGDYAFYNCSSLTSVEIPDSVTSIGWYAFVYCSRLKNLYISDLESWLNVSLSSYSHPLYSAGGNLYIDGVLATDIKIPDTVKSISDCAFYNCDSLTSVEIPDSVTRIGEGAFEYCRSLTSVEIPDSVTSIGDSAFLGCSSLKSIFISDNVTSMGEDVLLGCEGIIIKTRAGSYAKKYAQREEIKFEIIK